MYALFNTEQNALSFYSYINIQHPNIKFTMEREENHKFPFLYVLLDNNYSNQGIITLYKRLCPVFHKKTCTGLLTNFYSFVPFSYKSGLIRILIDRTFKINNTRAGFHLDINNLIKTLKRNLFPSNIIENVVRKFLNITSPPILLRVLLVRKIVFILNYRTSVLFPSQRNAELRNQLIHFPVTSTLSWCSPRSKLRVGLGQGSYPCGFTIASYL